MNILLATVTIPDFISKVQVSKSRRPKYYEKGKKLLKKYSDNSKFDYVPCTIGKKTKYLLKDLNTNELVVANSKSVGTPRYKIIRGNEFYSGFSRPAIRNNLMNSIKASLLPHFKSLKPFNNSVYPLYIEFVYHDERKQSQDLDNLRYAYEKAILDILHKPEYKLNVIPEDTVDYVSKLSSEFVETTKRKLVINFYKR